jgi:hypothetical protein
MFIQSTFVFAIIVGTASGVLATTKQPSGAHNHDVYDARGMYVGSDPEANVRFELDQARGQ